MKNIYEVVGKRKLACITFFYNIQILNGKALPFVSNSSARKSVEQKLRVAYYMYHNGKIYPFLLI